jgi:hypothetical protein
MFMNSNRIAMGMAGLAILFSACEKVELSRGSGEKVAVLFSTSSSGYDTEEIRSAGAKLQETVVVHMEDDVYMYATLKEEPAENQASGELREALTNNQKIRFAAFDEVGDPVGTPVTYTYIGGRLVPNGDPVGVEPDGETVYRFVAYSYYGSKGTDPVETAIHPSRDVVWGAAEQTITDTESGKTVAINMEHKFSQVRVKLDASTIATDMTVNSVQLVGGETANLDIKEGDVEATGTAVTQAVTGWTGTGSVRTSGYYVFYPSVTKVRVGVTLSRDGTNKTFSNLIATFNKALETGKSYTLVVDLKKLVWAASNIYWNGSKLMFSETTNSTYQGVFFKWGSLVGISPTEVLLTQVTAYYPPVGGIGNWTTKVPASQAEYGAIPYYSASESTTHATDENYLYEHPDFENNRGDICSYLTNGVWRIMNRAEIAVAADWTTTFSSVTVTPNATGTIAISAGVTYNLPTPKVFLPASGYRMPSSYGYAGRGASGYYWTGSSRPHDSATSGRCFIFSSGLFGAYDGTPANAVCSIRCVKN